MKIQIFKDKNGNIQSWHTGSSEISVQISDKSTGEKYQAVKETYEIDGNEGKKLQTNEYDPMIKNGKLEAVKNISAIFKEMQEQEKKNLKTKFQSGNFTNEDIKKLADLVL